MKFNELKIKAEELGYRLVKITKKIPKVVLTEEEISTIKFEEGSGKINVRQLEKYKTGTFKELKDNGFKKSMGRGCYTRWKKEYYGQHWSFKFDIDNMTVFYKTYNCDLSNTEKLIALEIFKNMLVQHKEYDLKYS